jgi:RNA-binding protein YlmH
MQINKIRNEKGDITTETKEIQKIIRSYYKAYTQQNMKNLGEIDDFLNKYQYKN